MCIVLYITNRKTRYTGAGLGCGVLCCDVLMPALFSLLRQILLSSKSWQGTNKNVTHLRNPISAQFPTNLGFCDLSYIYLSSYIWLDSELSWHSKSICELSISLAFRLCLGNEQEYPLYIAYWSWALGPGSGPPPNYQEYSPNNSIFELTPRKLVHSAWNHVSRLFRKIENLEKSENVFGS